MNRTTFLSTTKIAVLGAMLGIMSANAASVLVNTGASPGTAAPAAFFFFRASQANYDLALSNPLGTSAAANFVAGNLGAATTYTANFSIQHVPGHGFIFTTVRGATTRTLAWGSFAPAIAATAQAGTLNNMAPNTPYNTLGLDSVVGESGASVRLRNLVFTSAGTSVTGSFFNSTTTAGAANQFLVADTDLSTVAWTLSGEVRIARTAAVAANDNEVTFTISARQGGALTPVPEPAGAVLLLAGLAGLMLRRKRA